MTGLSVGNQFTQTPGLSTGGGMSRGNRFSFDGFIPQPAILLDFTTGTLDSRVVYTLLSPATNTGLGTMYNSAGYITYRPNNLLLNSATLSTQNVTTTAASPYILSFKGTGTVTLSGTSTSGPLVGTGANNRVYLKFTPTAGTLTLTVSGTVTEAQLEAVTYETEPRAYNATTGSAYYGPRFDYNPAHGQSGALLLQEGNRTNAFVYSTNLSTGNYGNTNTTKTLSAVLGPDNYTAAYYVTATANNGSITGVPGSSSTTTRSASVFLRRKTGTGTITFGSGTSTVDCTAVPSSGWTRYQVNLADQNGTYSVTGNLVTVTITNHGFISGERVRAVYTSGTAPAVTSGAITVTGANTFTFAQTTADTSGNVTIYPSCTTLFLGISGDEVYAWGWQYEFSYGASSYIPTNGATVTRVAEKFSITSTNFSSWFTLTGTVYAEYAFAAVTGAVSNGTHFAITNNTTTGMYANLYNTSTGIRFDTGTSGSSSLVRNTQPVVGTLYKVAKSINATNWATVAKFSGQSAVTGTAVTTTTPTQIEWGGTPPSLGNQGFYWLKSFAFYNQSLSQTQIGNLVP